MDLIIKKIFGLFHDPPWKPWVITGDLRGINEIKCYNDTVKILDIGEDVHEKQGISVALKVLERFGKQISTSEAKQLLEEVHKADILSAALDRFLNAPSGRIVNQSEKVNVFDPKLRYGLTTKGTNINVKGFVCELLQAVTNVKSNSDKLVDLYNYLYANIELIWYNNNDRALPLADTRVKTYSVFDHLYSTVSLLNWYNNGKFEGYLVKLDLPGVQDIISRSRKIYDLWGGSWLVSALAFLTILPFIEKYGVDVVLSPFMGLNPFFHSYLRKKLKIKDLKIKDYMEEYDATQPVMPATVILALPKDWEKEEDLKKEIRENYLKYWQKIVEKVEKNVIQKSLINSNESIAGRVKDELEKIKDHPIVPIRVDVQRVNISLTDEIDLVIKFDRMFRCGFRGDYIKFSYGVSAYSYANEVSKEKYSNGELFKHCTVCGVLPATIENVDELEEGEALCPYCYLRRALHEVEIDELEVKRGIIPSTIDLANLNNWYDILKEVKEVKEKIDVSNISLPEPLADEENDAKKAMWKICALTNRLFVEKVGESKGRLTKGETGKEQYLTCSKLVKELFGEELGKKIDSLNVNLYYAIVKGDGDFIGKKLLRGKLNIELKDYIMDTREKKNVDKQKLEKFAEKFRKYLTEECKDTVDVNKTIPITPDYIIALSRALMLVALKDIDTVRKYGVIVYAGGDDIAFLSPLNFKSEINTAFYLAWKTREEYWGSLEGVSKGFMNFKGGIFDLPAAYGRSYSLFITHYKEPFFTMWNLAYHLEEMKDDYPGKDVTFVLRGRGNVILEDAAVLKNDVNIFRALEDLYTLMTKRKLSNSFIKDVLSDELLGIADKYPDLTKKLVEYYVERNKKVREDIKLKLLDLNIKVEKKEANCKSTFKDQMIEVIKAYSNLEV
ncbi:type III-B CRISPR-associated protein Cas10/Cmr2 [Acidianus sulfidivorans]|uniref:type III-B CRISPR-associated protein Cas10/Cmr2 n=1 Tax=Acidianus sulfidivorans TaxID=312539 RepID=UPI0013A5892C|nr:type III-B CRISPR-associated protein Cas10/Cmr2 [Acidianus sulfidivorans]